MLAENTGNSTTTIRHDKADSIKIVKGQKDSYGYEIDMHFDLSANTTEAITKVMEIKKSLEEKLFGREITPTPL